MQSRRCRRFAPVLAIFAIALCAAGCSSCPGTKPPPKADAAVDPAVSPAGTASGRFLGSPACKTCHEGIYASWEKSRHHETLRPLGSGFPSTSKLAGQPLADGFAVEEGGAVRGPGPDREETRGTAAYLIGGRHREDLLVRFPDGRLQVFPFSFDLDGDRVFEPLREIAGGVSPPADTVDYWTRFGRNADFGCYGCHATGQVIDVAGGNPAGNAIPRSRWVEAGVGCEACHGPGGPHVESARTSPTHPEPPPWTGKGRDAETTVAACATCHGLRELLRSPFQATPAAGYGVPLWNCAEPVLSFRPNAEFRQPLLADLRPQTYQQEAIALGQSECVRKGGLTCSQCHDPHGANALDAARLDSTCLPCHEKIVATVGEHSRHAPTTPGGRCIDCHMARILRGPGTEPALDHSLAPPVAERGELPAACGTCHGRKEDRDKILAGWNGFGGRSQESTRRRTLAAATADADRQAPRATQALARALLDPDQGWFVRFALATRLQGVLVLRPTREAGPALSTALADDNPAVRRAVLRALAIGGRPSDLEAAQRMTSEADPFVALEAASSLVGLRDPAARGRIASTVARPDLTGEFRGQLALGRAALIYRDWPRAEETFTRAIELNPFLANAMNDLGIALFTQGKVDRAQQVWKQALDFNPQFEAARRNLEESEGAPPVTKAAAGASP